MNQKLRFITRTALLLAIAIVVQLMGKFMGPQNNFIVGPVVNAVLLIATEITGVFSGIFISIVAPLVSAFTNKSAIAPVILSFSPFIIGGNIILVLCYALFKKRDNLSARIGGVALGAVAKFAFLYASISIFVELMKINAKIAISLIALFSWPQLITAIVGGIIALSIIPALKRTVKD